MFGRVVMALARSPLYGIAVSVPVMPITLVGIMILAAFGVAAIMLFLLVFLLVFTIQVAVFIQTARFAASFTGFRTISKQPDFFLVAGKGLVIFLLGQILLCLLTGAVIVFFLEFRGGEALWWLNPDRLWKALQKVMLQPDIASYIFSFDGFDLDGLMTTLRASYMVFLTVMAIFVVPLACGTSWGTSERTYTVGLIVIRFLIAMPILAFIAGLVSFLCMMLATIGVEAVWPTYTIPVYFQFVLELAFFSGMIFSFEALLLKTGQEQEEFEIARHEAYLHDVQDDLRALRQSRTHE